LEASSFARAPPSRWSDFSKLSHLVQLISHEQGRLKHVFESSLCSTAGVGQRVAPFRDHLTQLESAVHWRVENPLATMAQMHAILALLPLLAYGGTVVNVTSDNSSPFSNVNDALAW
jgi:hypothetical protein